MASENSLLHPPGLRVINKATPVRVLQFALFEVRRSKSCGGHFPGDVLISGQSEVKSTGRCLPRVMNSLNVLYVL